MPRGISSVSVYNTPRRRIYYYYYYYDIFLLSIGSIFYSCRLRWPTRGLTRSSFINYGGLIVRATIDVASPGRARARKCLLPHWKPTRDKGNVISRRALDLRNEHYKYERAPPSTNTIHPNNNK